MKHPKLSSALIMALLVLGNVACQKQVPAQAQFNPTATLQEIMTDIIDPNIDYVWNSVATVSTKKGIEERAPKTDEEWAQVRQHALVVLEASNLLLIDGRPVAHPGANTSAHQVELGPEAIQKTISENPQSYVAFAHALHESVTKTIVAINAKDVAGLIEQGSAVDAVCEGCHKKFWYPGDKRPTSIPSK
jgi:hypothetical protein